MKFSLLASRKPVLATLPVLTARKSWTAYFGRSDDRPFKGCRTFRRNEVSVGIGLMDTPSPVHCLEHGLSERVALCSLSVILVALAGVP